MSRYRKISPTIWNDEKFRTLSDDAQLVFLYLLTHPHQTSLGAMRASVPGLAAEKRWKLPRFAKAFDDIEASGMMRHDPEASFVWLPKFLKHNPPENPNVVRSWIGGLELLPECGMKAELVHCVQQFVEGLTKGFAKAFAEAFAEALPEPFRKSMPIQEQEQEQEQEYKSGAKAPDSSSNKRSRKLTRSGDAVPAELQAPVSRIIGKMNELAGTHYSNDKPAPLRNLLGRLHEGKTEAECLVVVEGRHREWSGDEKMMEYFRPSTLFAAVHFEEYLQAAQRANGTNGHAKPAEVKDIGNGMVEVDGLKMTPKDCERKYGTRAN